MLRRHKRLIVLTTLILVTASWWGCSQPEDILYGKSTTLINLFAERLPTTPDGMTYQLWVADTIMNVGSGDSLFGSMEIGEPFTYNFDLNRFYDADGLARPDTNEFRLAGDILNYQWIFLSVERKDGFGSSPGPVMVIDTVTPTGISELDMVFPLSDSLWYIAVEFNMESPSNGRDSASDGAAVWFSFYAERTWTAQDTTGMPSWTIDTVTPARDTFLPSQGTCIQNIVNIFNETVKDTSKVYGFDTIHWSIVKYDQELQEECDYGQGSLFETEVDIVYETGTVRRGVYDDFQQVAINLPDLRSMGWLYEGWVVSSVIEDLEVGIGEMTLPAWVGLNQHDSTIRAASARLLSTGRFHSLEEPDYGNPYVDDPDRVPPFPGEDFLKSLPNRGDIEVNLVPDHPENNPGPSTGTVFIAMSPTNAVTNTTNFPLIIQIADIPSDRYAVAYRAQQFIMKGMVGHNTFGMGVSEGLPQIKVKIKRF